ncbi:MAG: phosphopyruvate hydratase [Frankiaceae bacterium]|nr:phosphopyruvate hydratase [Frankiaceae bacterium]
MRITEVRGRRVWDSRGRPTVEVELTCQQHVVRAIAPAGASRGSAEARDRRDGGSRLGGWDVTEAVAAVNTEVRDALLGVDPTDQAGADAVLDHLDPTPTRSRLGGNVTTATSLAVLHAGAALSGVPVWTYLGRQPSALPRPEVQIIGGGAHAAGTVDVQDFMVVPLSAQTMEQALVDVAEVYLGVGTALRARGRVNGVADEGGHWPHVDSHEQALELLVEGIERAGLVPGDDVAISLDLAASELAEGTDYVLASESRRLSRADWLDRLGDWCSAFPIVALEDPAGEFDHDGLRTATERLATGVDGRRRLIIGDDSVVTSAARITEAAAAHRCNAALIKVNQAGTVTAAQQAVDAARAAHWGVVVSARSGETEDVSVAHLAVGWCADLVKVGSITRGERTAKWNELLRIAEATGLGLTPPF